MRDCEVFVNKMVGQDANTSSPTSSPSRKRNRDLEDEVYLDNLHSHKRYLSEIMASSLNGLTVGESLSENLMDSPGRSESLLYARDEISSQYSPMSEDSDDARYYESSNCPFQPESIPTSPVSPYRCQKPLTSSYPSHSSIVSSSMPRQRGSDTEGRFPSSPSDICHSADLRRAALLRSVQMRAQPSCLLGPELTNNMEAEERPCSYVKAVDNNEREYKIAGCSQTSIPEHQDTEEKCENINHDLETG